MPSTSSSAGCSAIAGRVLPPTYRQAHAEFTAYVYGQLGQFTVPLTAGQLQEAVEELTAPRHRVLEWLKAE